ncbi:MAG: NAD(P)H-dependent oxidoreductase [Acidimicrobiales bacterium]
MSLFRLDASIRPEGSYSRALANIVEATWREENPDADVIRRDIGLHPLPSTLWPLAVAARRTPEAERDEEQRDAIAQATVLADEVLNADSLLFAVPLYNFGVSQHFKAWVDVEITDPRLSPASKALEGRPAVAVLVRGGAYGPGTPREGWDHSSGWIRRILADVWGLDLEVVELEFALVGVNPALDQFKELAEQMRADAKVLAAERGHHLTHVAVTE